MFRLKVLCKVTTESEKSYCFLQKLWQKPERGRKGREGLIGEVMSHPKLEEHGREGDEQVREQHQPDWDEGDPVTSCQEGPLQVQGHISEEYNAHRIRSCISGRYCDVMSITRSIRCY